MALDITTNGAAIRRSVDSVLSGRIVWVVFGYEGKTFTLKVVAEGRDKNDMFDMFSPAAVMYGYAKVNKPNALPSEPSKFVFIYWQGECAQEKYRINCAQHGDVVKRFCRTVHVTVQARNDDDLDWNDIIAKVAGVSIPGIPTSQANSLHEDEDNEVVATVGSVYKRVNPAADIPKSTNQRNFWQRQQSGPNVTAPPKSKKPVGWVKPVCPEGDTGESIQARSQALKEARQAEVASVIQSRLKSRSSLDQTNGDPSSTYKKIDPRADIMLARQLSKTSCDDAQDEPVGTTWHRLDAKAEIMAAKRAPIKEWHPDPSIKVGTNYERPDFQSEIRAARANRTNNFTESEALATPSPAPACPAPTMPPAASTHPSMPPLAQTIKAPSLPKQETVHPPPPVPPVEISAETTETRTAENVVREPEANHRLVPSVPIDEPIQAAPVLAPPAATNGGPVAVCLYNYTAGDDDELSFMEGDRIFQVQQIDEGWWLGVNADGQQGLFPANYVELMA
ncbi:Lim and sh3 domain protein 1 [Fasciola gigantica]|uniref:Lim and sh3 domain protein 1 n=1 Tax=Fasciola gigantica TaxID=46835 RepID=A0A504YTF4_FASGI|nr:Lim and sh3 domain protein 1 [Fasciola gigantica]